MPGGGDSGPDGEEESDLSLEETPAEAPGGAGGAGRRETVSSGRRGGRGEESGEAGCQDDEEMLTSSGSHDLLSSISANHSPRSTTGSTSTISTSTSKSEHTESGDSRRELMTTVSEMRKRLPSDKRSSSGRSKARTVDALQYALNCVKQVQANSEYYKLLMCSGQEERQDATVCPLVELERMTSEHALKNTDSLVVVFSLASGRVLFASEQAPSILCCKRKFLESAKFVELLFHQDVNVFYSHTAQPHLPPWSSKPTAAVLFECAQVKSFFCRIRGGKDREGEMRYNPFRMTPYLLKVQGTGGTEESCCLALAERIISGYEAPRIPMDKRIFTTTHSPGCVFLEVDDRAVPLLGYLPQDLIGTSLLSCVHPEDRPLMLSVHRKVLKHAGQPPFEHSPLRLRCQNGDYITLDTSWSSYINPWSRKVAFIIGRHKVRTSPLNEDVFAARSKDDLPTTHDEIKTLQAKIYKLFLQPVSNNGSSGYGSLGSNGSHEHHISLASSSDSNGNLWEDSHREPMTLQQVCADVNRVKSWGQQTYLDSRHKLIPLVKPATAAPPPTEVRGHHNKEGNRKQPHVPSYQQINCVDNIIKFLESCTPPDLKRKNECRSQATSSSSSSSSSSEDDKPTAQAASDEVVLESQVSVDTSTAAAVVGAPLTDITMSTKAMSVTSLCSYSSTIVHVPQPESEVTALEDTPMGSEPSDPPAAAAPTTAATPAPDPDPALAGSAPHSPTHSSSSAPTEEELRLLGLLTKEVLSAHTQKEEKEYVDRFQHRILQSPYWAHLSHDSCSLAPHSHHPGDTAVRPLSAAGRGGGWSRSRTGKPKHKRAKKPQDSSDSYASPPDPLMQRSRPPHSSWPSSESSLPQVGGGVPVPYNNNNHHHQMPLQTPYLPMMTSTTPHQPGLEQQMTGLPPMVLQPPDQTQTQSLNPGLNFNMQSVHLQSFQIQNIQNFPCVAPINPYAAASPLMAVILPSYPAFTPGGFPATSITPGGFPAASIFPPPTVSSMMMPQPQVPFTMAGGAPPPFLQTQAQFQFQAQPEPPPPPPPPHTSPPVGGPLFGGEGEEEEEEEAGAGPPALFSSSRSSSPLQLNLLQEELPSKPSEGGAMSVHGLSEQHHGKEGDDAPSESGNHDDAQSSSSELLDLMLQEDARSASGSASGSGSGESGRSLGSGSGESGRSLGSGSGSNGTSTSHTGSSNSSKYFASNDSSDTSRKARKSQQQEAAAAEHQQTFEPRVENSLWTMIQHTPESVMMTYQIPSRDQEEVLAEDREKLRVLEPMQPWFSHSQRRELRLVHPWIHQHCVPSELDTQDCVGCSESGMMSHSPPLSPPPPPPVPDSSSPMESPEQQDPQEEDPQQDHQDLCGPLQDT